MNGILALTVLLSSALTNLAQDVEYEEAVVAAQRLRPRELASAARIAPETEPGTPLVVHGRAFAEDGRTPLVGAVVFGYHTDREGRYDRQGAPAHSWRLKGWAKTDREGRFEFRTIRPGPYPRRQQAAHIHFAIFTADGARYHAGEAEFEDDPLVRETEREATRKDPVFGAVRAVRKEGSVEHIDANLRVAAGRKF